MNSNFSYISSPWANLAGTQIEAERQVYSAPGETSPPAPLQRRGVPNHSAISIKTFETIIVNRL